MGNDDEQPGHLFYVSDGRLKESVYNEKQSRYGGISKSRRKRNISREVMHKILRWRNFELAKKLDHVSKPRNGLSFQSFRSKLDEFQTSNAIRRMDFLRILSNLRFLYMQK